MRLPESDKFTATTQSYDNTHNDYGTEIQQQSITDSNNGKFCLHIMMQNFS